MPKRRGGAAQVLISYRCLTVKDGRRCPGEVHRVQDRCPLCKEPVILAAAGADPPEKSRTRAGA